MKNMIKANEFREGIFVLDAAPYDKVHRVDLNMIINALGEGYGYRGIPLTPEWMEKCGFEYKEPFFIKRPIMLSKNYFRDASGNYQGFVIRMKIEDGIQVLVVQYVHQLQNLYFDLTGDELEIKY